MNKIGKWCLSALLAVTMAMPVWAAQPADQAAYTQISASETDNMDQTKETGGLSTGETGTEETGDFRPGIKETESETDETSQPETGETEPETKATEPETEETELETKATEPETKKPESETETPVDPVAELIHQVTTSVPVMASVKCTGFQLTVAWKKVSSYTPDGYYLYKRTGKEGWKRIAALGADKSSYVDKSAQYGVKCTYTVRAYKKIEGRGYISNYDRGGMSAVVQPAAPKMTVKEAEYKTVVLSWNAIGNADEYTLYRMNPSTKKWEYQATLKETSYRAAVICGKSYTYTVRARKNRNGQIERGDYDKKGITFKTKLNTPVLKKAVSKSYNSIMLSWEKVDGAQKYEVYRKIGGTGYKYIGDTASTSYIDTVTCGDTYTYTVRAYRVESGVKAYSGYNKSGITASAVVGTPVLKEITGSNYKKIDIRWSSVEGTSAYYIYRKIPGGEWSRIGTVKGGNKTLFTDLSADANQVYAYTVRAVRTENHKNILSKYDRTGVYWVDCPKVTDVRAAKDAVVFTWPEIHGADEYLIYKKTGTGGWTRFAVVDGSAENSYRDEDCKEGVMYRYTVRACASTGGKSVLSDYERAPMPVVCLDIQTEMNIQPEGGEEQVMVSIQNNAEKSIILGDAMSVNPDTGASTFFDAYSSENVKAGTIEVLSQTNQRIIYKAEEASGMTKDSEYILYIYMMYDGEEYLLCISQGGCYITGGNVR